MNVVEVIISAWETAREISIVLATGLYQRNMVYRFNVGSLYPRKRK
jgi:hypothetical protein